MGCEGLLEADSWQGEMPACGQHIHKSLLSATLGAPARRLADSVKYGGGHADGPVLRQLLVDSRRSQVALYHSFLACRLACRLACLSFESHMRWLKADLDTAPCKTCGDLRWYRSRTLVTKSRQAASPWPALCPHRARKFQRATPAVLGLAVTTDTSCLATHLLSALAQNAGPAGELWPGLGFMLT